MTTANIIIAQNAECVKSGNFRKLYVNSDGMFSSTGDAIFKMLHSFYNEKSEWKIVDIAENCLDWDKNYEIYAESESFPGCENYMYFILCDERQIRQCRNDIGYHESEVTLFEKCETIQVGILETKSVHTSVADTPKFEVTYLITYACNLGSGGVTVTTGRTKLEISESYSQGKIADLIHKKLNNGSGGYALVNFWEIERKHI